MVADLFVFATLLFYTFRYEMFMSIEGGLPHGYGTCTYARGSGKYVGEWKNGEQDGNGTYTFASGNKYVGEWKNDKRHGQGT